MDPDPNRLTVVCGANLTHLDDASGLTLATLRHKLREVLNITNDHVVVLVNGVQVSDLASYRLNGTEEVEFKKPSGQKG